MADENENTAGDPFTGGGTATAEAPAEPQVPPSEPASAPEPSEPSPGADAPDLSEQEQTLLDKLAGPLGDKIAERVGPQDNSNGEMTEDGLLDHLLQREEPGGEDTGEPAPAGGDDLVYQTEDGRFVDSQGNQVPESEIAFDQGQGAQLPPQDPRVDAIVDFLQQQAQTNQEQQVRQIISDNADLRQPEILQEVERKAEQMAQALGAPDQALNPVLVENALKAVRSERAAPSQTTADEARREGAELETGAGASVAGSESDDNEKWGSISGSGGSAFPS